MPNQKMEKGELSQKRMQDSLHDWRNWVWKAEAQNKLRLVRVIKNNKRESSFDMLEIKAKPKKLLTHGGKKLAIQ